MGAALAATVSKNPAYREAMFNKLTSLEPDYTFNTFMHGRATAMLAGLEPLKL